MNIAIMMALVVKIMMNRHSGRCSILIIMRIDDNGSSGNVISTIMTSMSTREYFGIYDLNVSKSESDTQGVARLNVISSLILVTPLG